MKRILALVLCTVMLFSLCSCTSTEENKDNSNNENAVELTKVREEIINSLGIGEPIFIETEALGDFYGIDAALVKQSASFATMSGTFPHEVIMIETVDADALETVKKALDNKLKVFSEQSKAYDAENYALAQKCKVYTSGNFAVLFLSPDYEKMQTVLDKYI